MTWRILTAEQKRIGKSLAVMDSLIAATALQHKLVLVTHKVADFRVSSLSVLNPWE